MRPYIIVFGNEKGGTGKSTLAMNVVVYLLKAGFKVATIDLDARQGTLSRYIENRKESPLHLDLPKHKAIFIKDLESKAESITAETEEFNQTILDASDCHFIVIDTPGTNTYLSRLGHSYADTLVTPMNDSFIDLDMLAKVDSNDMNNIKPSTYAEMVWSQRLERAKRKLPPTDWLVVRNRLSTLLNKNKVEINNILEKFSKRIGFRLGVGFCERVIFKELFLQGMTLLDFDNESDRMNLSHISARQELRELIKAMNIKLLSLPPRELNKTQHANN